MSGFSWLLVAEIAVGIAVGGILVTMVARVL
jgi:hypothetical protein